MTQRTRKRDAVLRVVSGGGTIDADAGWNLWRRYEVDDPALPYDVTFDVDLEAGRLVCTAMRVAQRPGGPPVNTDDLRTIKVATLVREAAAMSVRTGMRSTGDGGLEPADDPAVLAAYLKERKRRGGGTGTRITDEDLEQVAVSYREALRLGRPTGRHVMERLRLRTEGQARRWIKAARDAGYLGAAPGNRRKGELTEGEQR